MNWMVRHHFGESATALSNHCDCVHTPRDLLTRAAKRVLIKSFAGFLIGAIDLDAVSQSRSAGRRSSKLCNRFGVDSMLLRRWEPRCGAPAMAALAGLLPAFMESMATVDIPGLWLWHSAMSHGLFKPGK